MQAGSTGATTQRIVTRTMARNLRQALNVENLPGAAGIIGARRPARTLADCCTIGGIAVSTLSDVPILRKRTDVDPLALFEPISLAAASTWLLNSHPSLPVRSVPALVRLVH